MSVSTSADASLTRLSPSEAGLAQPLIRGSVAVCVGIVLLAAVLLAVRRGIGAISTPLPASALIALGIGLTTLARALRSAWAHTNPPRAWTVALWAVLTFSTITFAATVTVPGSAPFGLACLWLAVVAGEAWCWRPRRAALAERPVSAPNRSGRAAPAANGMAGFEQAVADSSLGLELPQEHVTQQLTRLQEPDGTDRVVGWMRVSFEPGQRLASVHLAFCPPFGRMPEAALERLDGPQLRIKRIQVFPFGARFDLKLNVPAEQATNVLLRVDAEVPGHEPAVEPSEAEEPGQGASEGE